MSHPEEWEILKLIAFFTIAILVTIFLFYAAYVVPE